MDSTHKPTVVRTMPWDGAKMSRELLLNREWLVTNGLGGYASGTISGAITRRYHGLLIAALPAPLGRMVMWSHVSEFLRFSDNDVISLGGAERASGQINEQSRGYAYEGDLWSPGFFHIDLHEHDSATLVGSTEKWEIVEVLTPEQALAAECERRARLLDRTT